MLCGVRAFRRGGLPRHPGYRCRPDRVECRTLFRPACASPSASRTGRVQTVRPWAVSVATFSRSSALSGGSAPSPSLRNRSRPISPTLPTRSTASGEAVWLNHPIPSGAAMAAPEVIRPDGRSTAGSALYCQTERRRAGPERTPNFGRLHIFRTFSAIPTRATTAATDCSETPYLS